MPADLFRRACGRTSGRPRRFVEAKASDSPIFDICDPQSAMKRGCEAFSEQSSGSRSESRSDQWDYCLHPPQAGLVRNLQMSRPFPCYTSSRLISRDTRQAIDRAITTDPAKNATSLWLERRRVPLIARTPLYAAFDARLPGRMPRNVSRKLPLPWSSCGVSRETPRSANASSDDLRHDQGGAAMAPTISSGDGLFVYEATQLSKAQPSPLLTSLDAGETRKTSR
jgi:hypothetical protein